MVKKPGGRDLNPADAHRCACPARCFHPRYCTFALSPAQPPVRLPCCVLLTYVFLLSFFACRKAERVKEIARNKKERQLQRAALKQR